MIDFISLVYRSNKLLLFDGHNISSIGRSQSIIFYRNYLTGVLNYGEGFASLS